MRKSIILLAVALAVLALVVPGAHAKKPQKYKKVIALIPDGCSASIQTVARWYKRYIQEDMTPLALDEMGVSGMVQTYMANSVTTGSAAAATAFATGHKTSARFLGIGPKEDDLLTDLYGNPIMNSGVEPYAPMASVLEAAKLKGICTGLVATSRITHATPAAYACHIQDRGWDNDIMEHMVYNDVDVVFGGGKRHLLPKEGSCANGVSGGYRDDCENLLEVLEGRGVQFAHTRDEMLNLNLLPAWGLFAMSHMDSDIDNAYFGNGEPTLAEMTAKAIELLSQGKKEFFLMVEGSQVDWAGHNNDPIYMITDHLAFDAAVRVALDYAEENKDTLVLVFPDHNTGALSIGNRAWNWSYTGMGVPDLLGPLAGMQVTSGALADQIGVDPDTPTLEDALKKYWGITATQEDLDEIDDLKDEVGLDYAIARVISKNHTVFGWTTHGHNAEDVPLWSYSKKDRPVGLFDNTDLAWIVADAFRCDLDETTKELFNDVEDVYPGQWELDKTDPKNPVLVIKDGQAMMPVSKDLLTKVEDGDEKTYELDSLTVLAPETGKVYISEQAIECIDKNKCPKKK
jgi:alkaline phosphatase